MVQFQLNLERFHICTHCNIFNSSFDFVSFPSNSKKKKKKNRWLGNNQISGTIPTELGKLKNLMGL